MGVRTWKIGMSVAVMCASVVAHAEAPSEHNDYVPARPDCQGIDSESLAQMYEADQADRQEGHPDRKKRDALRLADVLDQIDTLCTPGDHFHAAMILQHSAEPEHHLQAHRLARYAAERGHEKAMWLSGAAWDRYFASRGLPQFFGTQFTWNDAKQLCLIDVDPEATDEMRASWDMESIEQIYELILNANELSHLPLTRESLDRNGLVCAPYVWADWSPR